MRMLDTPRQPTVSHLSRTKEVAGAPIAPVEVMELGWTLLHLQELLGSGEFTTPFPFPKSVENVWLVFLELARLLAKT